MIRTAPLESHGVIRSGSRPVRVLFALPGLHRVVRGAEVAFEELARNLVGVAGCDVTLVGSGLPRTNDPYKFVHAGCLQRKVFEKWPRVPWLRSHYMYEELTFAPALLRAYDPASFDVTVTCAFPYTNYILRGRKHRGRRPRHIYVTQNGDWMIRAKNWEYRYFGCDGLVCTNPEFYDRHHTTYPTALIPNGVNEDMFCPGESNRSSYGLPKDMPVVLMVSAFINSKRVLEAIRMVAAMNDVALVVAGSGELESSCDHLAAQLMPNRYFHLNLPREKMPGLYRCADAFLHMSLIESSANAYIEALATGLPIVTHNRTVTQWTLEDTSILVDAESQKEVIAGIYQAIESNTPEQVQARRNLAIRRFSWSGIARQYADFFSLVLTASGDPLSPREYNA